MRRTPSSPTTGRPVATNPRRMTGAGRSPGAPGTAWRRERPEARAGRRHGDRERNPMTSVLRVNEPAASLHDDAAEQLARVMAERRITPVFQPILRFQEGSIIGHEALVRGPEGSLVHTPSELFAAA